MSAVEIDNSTITANKLYKSAIELGFTKLTFAEWIEKKNIDYVKYQNGGGELSFTDWEQKNQKNRIKAKSILVFGTAIALITIFGYYIINKNNQK